MSITAIVENDTIKLPPGLHVPDGTKAEIVLMTDTAVKDEGAAGLEEFRASLAAVTGIAKGKFTTDERMQETRGED